MSQESSPMAVKPGRALPTDILTGSVTAAGTLITIPAGRAFEGEIALQGGHNLAANVGVTVATAGTGVTPAAGAVVAGLRITGTASGVSAEAVQRVRVVAGSADATLAVAADGTVPAFFRVTANGVLL